MITHEYGHYLSLEVVKPHRWYPQLLQVLKDNGVLSKKVTPLRLGDEILGGFGVETQQELAKTGIGKYGRGSPKEFVAEARWRAFWTFLQGFSCRYSRRDLERRCAPRPGR